MHVAGSIRSVSRTLLVAVLGTTLVVCSAVVVHRGGAETLAAESPLAQLGTAGDRSGCVSAPLPVGRGTALYCADHAAVVVDRTIRVVSLYGPDDPVVGGYEGSLPEGLTWGEPLAEVLDALGDPARITPIYGPPTLVYMYDDGRAYHSLELVFDENDLLARINASLLH